MRLGMQMFASRSEGETTRAALTRLVERAQMAERFGFDIVWLAEHHRTDWNVCTDPLTLAAYIAAETTTIRIGTAVVNLGLHHPVDVVERANLVNDLSSDRLELGLGKGFSPLDYELYGFDPVERERAFESRLRSTHALLRSQFDTTQLPLWIATTGNPATVTLAGELDCGLLLTAYGDNLARICDGIKTTNAITRISLTRAVHIANDAVTAWTELAPHLAWYRDQLAALQPGSTAPPLDEVARTFCVIGTESNCGDRITDLGHDHRLTDFTSVVGIGGMTTALFSRTAHALPRVVAPVVSRLG